MSTISTSMSDKILNRLNKDNEKVRCFENLHINEDRWKTILNQLTKKYNIYASPTNIGTIWKSVFTDGKLTVETNCIPMSKLIYISEVNFAIGQKEIVDDFETLIKGGNIINDN